MPTPAKGKHPANVSAVIISEDEKAAKLREAPPGAGGTGPGASVTTQYMPSVDEQHAQELSDQLVGRAALLCASKLGIPYVWSTTTKKKITLESAETLCKKNPGLVYFDFDALEDIAADVERESRTLASQDDTDLIGEEYVEVNNVVAADENEIEDLNDPDVMAALEGNAELEVDPTKAIPDEDPLDPETRQSTRFLMSQKHIERARQEALDETGHQPAPTRHTISETEKRAWGGTLSTPGMQVYIHPNGIARVDVQGRVKLQTGISGNVRIFRIQALERPTGGVVRNITQTTVTGPKAPAQPPQSTTRQMNDRIPIPVPPKADLDNGTDY